MPVTFEMFRQWMDLENGRNAKHIDDFARALDAYSTSVTGLINDLAEKQDAIRGRWSGAATNALLERVAQDLGGLAAMRTALDDSHKALADLPAHIEEANKRVQDLAQYAQPYYGPQNENVVIPEKSDAWPEDTLMRQARAHIDPVMADYFAASTQLGNLPAKWDGRHPDTAAPPPPGQQPTSPGGPHPPGPGPGGPKTPKAPGGPGPGPKAPGGPGGAGDPSATGDSSATGDPGTGGLGSAGGLGSSDPGSPDDPSTMPPSGSDQTPAGLDNLDPSTLDPGNLPTDQNSNNPDQQNNVPINVPQLAGNPNVTQLPTTSSNPPDIKVPDPSPLPSSNSPTGPNDVVIPPGSGGGVNQSRTGGPSTSLPSTGSQAGNAPRTSAPPGQTAANAAAANRSGMPPMYPPPMGGMGGRGGSGGVKPGTAEKPGGPELGALGGAPGKPVEEIGVPARLRGRSAGSVAARTTRTPRRRSRKPGGGPAGSSAADERDEVLDEHLWRVDPPAMSDE